MNLIPPGVKMGSVLRRFHPDDLYGYGMTEEAPETGDVVLCRVCGPGRSASFENRAGREIALFQGDLILGVYGSRYAMEILEGVVPPRLHRAHLLAPSGIVGQVQSRNRLGPPPVEVEALGYVFDEEGESVHLSRNRLRSRLAVDLPTLLVLGAEMRSGKTTAMTGLVRALHEEGLRVGAARVSGTARRGDLLRLRDAGASRLLDFTAFGHASTYLLDEEDLLDVFRSTVGHLAGAGVDVVVLEMADGILQRETALLLSSSEVRDQVGAVLFSAADLLNAFAAHEILVRRLDLPLTAVTGPVANSALGIREVEDRTGVPCFNAVTSRCEKLVEVLGTVFPDLVGRGNETIGPIP